MTKKIYYERVGRKYVPVKEYDPNLMDSFPAGTHMVVCHPGGRSYRYNIDPAYAPMIAAGRVAEDAISKAVVKASEMRPQRTPLTPGQKKAWEKLAKDFGDGLDALRMGSARDHAGLGGICRCGDGRRKYGLARRHSRQVHHRYRNDPEYVSD
jgi:hypothetical protein